MKRRIWSRLGKVLFLLAALFALAVAVIAFTGLHDDLGHADLALVLGNTVQRGGRPSTRLQARLDRTVELWRAGLFPDVLVSGGTGREGFDEAAVMANYLAAHGIPREHILQDPAGVNTWASARATRDVLRQRHGSSVLVISQYFHLPRSRLALRRFGIGEIHSAHARWFEARDLYSLPREVFGWVSYRIRQAPGDA